MLLFCLCRILLYNQIKSFVWISFWYALLYHYTPTHSHEFMRFLFVISSSSILNVKINLCTEILRNSVEKHSIFYIKLTNRMLNNHFVWRIQHHQRYNVIVFHKFFKQMMRYLMLELFSIWIWISFLSFAWCSCTFRYKC